MEIHYDRAVVKDFVSRLPEALRADVGLGREFLRETLQYVRVTDGGERRRTCPICDQALGKITPQHVALHSVAPPGGLFEFPELGFTKGARLVTQPSPASIAPQSEREYASGRGVCGPSIRRCRETAPALALRRHQH